MEARDIEQIRVDGWPQAPAKAPHWSAKVPESRRWYGEKIRRDVEVMRRHGWKPVKQRGEE